MNKQREMKRIVSQVKDTPNFREKLVVLAALCPDALEGVYARESGVEKSRHGNILVVSRLAGAARRMLDVQVRVTEISGIPDEEKTPTL